VPELARALGEAGKEVTIVTLGSRVDPESADPCRVIRIARSRARPRRAVEVVRAVRKTRPRVVFANGLHLESAFMVGVPVVQKIVGDWAWERAQSNGWTAVAIDDFESADLPPRARALRLLRSAVTGRARLVVVPSRYVAGLVRGWGTPAERVRVVPNAAPPPKASSPSGSRRALFVGRLVRWKHVDHVFRALPSVGGLELEVVGDGPDRGRLERIARELGLSERVRFLGRLARSEVARRMDQASLLVLPSSYEGMPHVVLEAFSSGLPVVASEAGGTPEVIEHEVSGLLYPWGRIDRLVEVLNRALDAQVAERLAEGGRQMAGRLTTAASVEATVRVLEEAQR
jgi:glycosyltransferase involved in cell wall biosynthesis